jgi:hypothetical protein
MDSPLPLPPPNPPSDLGPVWAIMAAVAGLGCVVVPSYLLAGAKAHPAYGHPLIPWFAIAFANLHVVATMSSFFVLGMAFGVAQPRRWLLLACLAVSLPPLVNAINIIGDWTVDPTDHNLFPFEFAILAFISFPVLPGTFLGSKIRRVIHDRPA